MGRGLKDGRTDESNWKPGLPLPRGISVRSNLDKAARDWAGSSRSDYDEPALTSAGSSGPNSNWLKEDRT